MKAKDPCPGATSLTRVTLDISLISYRLMLGKYTSNEMKKHVIHFFVNLD